MILEGYISAQKIICDGSPCSGGSKSNNVCFAASCSFFGFRRVYITAITDPRRHLVLPLFLTNRNESLGAAETTTYLNLNKKHVYFLMVKVQSVALYGRSVWSSNIRSLVPFHSQPSQRIENSSVCARLGTGLIRIFEPDDKVATISLSMKPRPDGLPDVTHVRVTCWTRRISESWPIGKRARLIISHIEVPNICLNAEIQSCISLGKGE